MRASCLLLVCLAACGSEPAPTPAVPAPAAAPALSPPPVSAAHVASVSISVRPPDGGSAFCDFAVDGAVRGGHLSGDDPPFVHQDDGVVSPEVVAALRAAADSVLVEPRPVSSVADGAGTSSIDITLDDGTVFHHVWTFGAHSDDPRAVALETLLMEHHIGGW